MSDSITKERIVSTWSYHRLHTARAKDSMTCLSSRPGCGRVQTHGQPWRGCLQSF